MEIISGIIISPLTCTTDYTDLHGLKKKICGNLDNLWFFFFFLQKSYRFVWPSRPRGKTIYQ